MGSEGSEDAANPMPEWDLAAEKELVAAEKSYLAKRKKRFQIDQASGSGSPSHCPKARRLPAWTSPSPAHRSGDHNALAPTHAIPNSRNGVWNLAPHVRPGYQFLFLPTFHCDQRNAKLLSSISCDKAMILWYILKFILNGTFFFFWKFLDLFLVWPFVWNNMHVNFDEEDAENCNLVGKFWNLCSHFLRLSCDFVGDSQIYS